MTTTDPSGRGPAMDMADIAANRAARSGRITCDIAGLLSSVEGLRRACRRRLLGRSLSLGGGTGVLAWLMMTLPAVPDPVATAFVSGLAALIGWAYWAHRPLAEYRDAFKTRHVPALVQAAGGFRYEGSGRFPLEWISDSDIVPKCNIYDTAHLLSAQRSGVGIQCAEVDLTRFSDYQFGGRRAVTPEQAFGGLALLVSLRHAFRGRTAFIPDPGPLLRLFGDAPAWGNVAGPPIQTTRGSFEVFSTDTAEAAQLVTQPWLERLGGFAQSLGGEKPRLAFYEAQVLLLLPLRRGLFPVPSILGASQAPRIAVEARLRILEQMADLLVDVADAGQRQTGLCKGRPAP